jgi:predicted Zn-dependent peptidase
MTLIKEWFDGRYLSKNSIYQLKNGIKIVIVKKRGAKDFVAEACFAAGSYFEDDIGVPQGTAHFLEHMLTNPNSKFKNEDEIDKFKFGNRSKPSVYSNAWTSHKYMTFYAYGHQKGTNRILQFLKATLDYPTERFTEYMERERGVIQAELQRNYVKEAKDDSLASVKYLHEPLYQAFGRRVIGTKSSIAAISLEDLNNYYSNLITQDNLVLAIQTSKDLTQSQLKIIESFGQKLPKVKQEVTVPLVTDDNSELSIRHFQKEDTEGIFMSFSYFIPTRRDEVPHVEFIPNYFLRSLIGYLGFKIFREKLGLVYSMDHYRSYPLWFNYQYGFKMSFDRTVFQKVLDRLYEFIDKDLEEYLLSEDGKHWLESEISDYIFLRNVNYDGDYAQNLALDEVFKDREYIQLWEDAVEHAKSITTERLIEEVQKWKKLKPKVWSVSEYKDEEIYDIFKESKLYKYFKKL